MQFESFDAFLAMGGYGLYVWCSFAVTLAAMVGIIIDTKRQQQNLFKQVLQAASRRDRIRAAREENKV